MKKFLALLMCVLLSVGTVFGVTGCKGTQGSNDPNVLDIYCYIAGYRDEWLTGTIDLFKEQDWVKEKYPDLEVNYFSNSDLTTPFNSLNNQGVNTTDIFFAAQLNGIDPSKVVNLTDEVYLTKVPGTDQLIMDKLPQEVKDILWMVGEETRADGYQNYYTMSYVDTFYGFLYNRDKFAEVFPERGKDGIPVTTEEFYELCSYVEEHPYTYEYDGETHTCSTGLMVSAQNSYFRNLVPVYWAQYEGQEGFKDFYDGKAVVDGRKTTSEKIFEQTGRLRSLEEIEKTLTEHAYEEAPSANYTTAQGLFLAGEGLFHFNGDYFGPEMRLVMEDNKSKGIDYDIQYMPVPVTSSIVEVLPVNKNMSEETLRSVIKNDIDKNVAYANSWSKANGVAEEDFNRIAEARQIRGYWMIGDQNAVIPSQTPAKELACDFLRFMYTDEAIQNFSDASGGLRFPAIYYENLTTEEYEASTKLATDTQVGLTRIQKSKYDMIYKKGSMYPSTRLFSNLATDLGKAGLEQLASYQGNLGVDFTLENPTVTAKKIYDDDITYWTNNNNANWKNLLTLAGR